jgi:hypothetical protein
MRSGTQDGDGTPPGGRSLLNGEALIGAFGLLVAAFVWWQLRDLPLFEGFRVGSGYMPRLVLGLLALVSGVLLVRGLVVRGPPVPGLAARPLGFVCGALMAFALALEPLGLAPAAFLAVLICAAAAEGMRPVRAVILAAVMTGAALLLFVKLLGLPVKVWP